MSAAAPARPARAASRASRNRGLPFDKFLVLAALALLLCAVLLPLLVVALPLALLWFTGARRGWWPAWLPVLVGVLTGGAWALWLRAHGGIETALDGYLTVQQDALVLLVERWGTLTPRDALAYLGAVWPYAVPGGVVLGAVGWFVLSGVRSLPGGSRHNDGAIVVHDAGKMAAEPEAAVPWVAPRVVGLGVMTLVSGPPGIGKSYWTWGLLRAMQDGPDADGRPPTFYGLPITRPAVRRGWERALRRPARPARVLWCTEEGSSFAATARTFGIRPGLVCVLRRDQVGATDWLELVRLIRREAWQRGCRLVVLDTIRAWCPQAEVSNDGAAEVMRVARRELAEPGLGVLFVHHDRKGGGTYGEGVAGAYNLVGSVDVLVELKRVPEQRAARRMLVSRRYGEMDVTAVLEDARYVVPPPAPEPAAPSPVPTHLRETLDAVAAAGAAGALTADVQAATKGARATVLERLNALKALDLVAAAGAGTRGDPFRWTATGAPEPAPPPTADPAYVRYLGSAAWAAKRRVVLARANGCCETCGAPVADAEMEVHHPPETYALVPDEDPSLLCGLCPGCHRRAHAK